MLGLRPRTWGRLTLGVLVIGGTLALLWAVYDPAISPLVESEPAPRPPALHRAGAVVTVSLPGRSRARRARVSCDGRRQEASGFWARSPAEACDALASTRAALLRGGGCASLRRDRVRLHAVGHF